MFITAWESESQSVTVAAMNLHDLLFDLSGGGPRTGKGLPNQSLAVPNCPLELPSVYVMQ